MAMISIKTLLKRHQEEIEEFQNQCPHPKERIRVFMDSSQIGCGGLYPDANIICKRCGIKKVLKEVKPNTKIVKSLNLTMKDKKFHNGFVTTFNYLWELD